MERKINVGVAPSRNYDKVTIEILEETIEFNDEAEFKTKVKLLFDILNDLAGDEFHKLQGGN